MAISKGQTSTEGNVVKRYIGVSPVYVLAVNPNKAELEKLYNTQLENNPEYINEVEVDGVKYLNTRIDFIIKTDAEKTNIDFTTKVSFFLRKQYRFNRDQSKVQVIDKYGRTCWVTKEQCKNKEIPVYSNGPANIDKDYRPCYVGEEDLTNFIKAYLNIPNVMKFVNSTWIMVDNPQDCEARLDKIENYFKGDFSELKSAIALQPTNKVKVLFGVRNTDDGKQYQTVYTQMVLKNSVTDYSRLDKDVQERKANGAYSTTEFAVCNLKEYTVESTNFNNTNVGDMPFDAPAASPWAFN